MNDILTLTTTGSDRSTAYHQANKIVRATDGYYVTWLDSNYRCILAHVTAAGQLRNPVPLAQGFDNHCGGALTQPADGTLHFVSGSHAHGFVYRHTKTPHDPASWSLPQGVGRSATYPSLVHDPAGTLHLAHRHSAIAPPEPWGICYFTSTPPQPWQWSGTSLVVRMPAPLYSYPTNALAVGADGTLHLVLEWYKTWTDDFTPAHSVGVTHLERPAGGDWQHTDGRLIKVLPAKFEDAFPILTAPAGNPRPGNVAVLPDNQPVFGCWDSNTGRITLCIRAANRIWRTLDLLAAHDPGRVFNSQPQIAINAAGEIVLVAGRAPTLTWGDPASQLHAFWIDPATGGVKRHRVIPKTQPTEPDWLPSIEKPGPGQYPAELALLFQTGRRGVGCVNDVRCAVNFTSLS